MLLLLQLAKGRIYIKIYFNMVVPQSTIMGGRERKYPFQQLAMLLKWTY